ncbi:MAG: hypothetical protein LH475_01580 [Cryobacterium sp.]|uniref:hypothetical protein n=1 Tax=unclassified Cryobacterium TaxID=2649013 RepID=UPI0018C8E174|nr:MULTISPECIES: hypothetical protein [unclassified Cryobacterium]MCY7403320.1 hypothetical protein [Cryobacterium sp.]MEC5154409.1 hypothetical protein [Cryobacterium sp. CAN_C3]
MVFELYPLARRGIPLARIADSSARRHADGAAVWLECPIDSASAFDGYAIRSVYEDLEELEAPW